MHFPDALVQGRLQRRYKRFLADVLLEDGREVTAACPNTGTMLGLTAPGSPVWLSPARSKTRKLPFTWELIAEPDGTLVGINTGLPNRLAREAIEADLIPELSGYQEIKAEQRYDENSRIDLLLSAVDRPPCFVEIKNVHLRRAAGLAEFPDCVTTRGAKHLAALARQVVAGARAVMLFVVQRGDCARFGLAADLDPGYKAAFEAARAGGVECLIWDCAVSPEAIVLRRPLPLLK